jgi:hypothetical protein
MFFFSSIDQGAGIIEELLPCRDARPASRLRIDRNPFPFVVREVWFIPESYHPG